jgi:hypothetical protein
MITIEHTDGLVSVAVLGEFMLADFREFEEIFNYKIKFQGLVNVLFDLRQMASFTLDVAWEEIKFSRQHAQDFGRIAVLTDSQWVAWSAWLSQLFVDAETEVFESEADARAWVCDGAE